MHDHSQKILLFTSSLGPSNSPILYVFYTHSLFWSFYIKYINFAIASWNCLMYSNHICIFLEEFSKNVSSCTLRRWIMTIIKQNIIIKLQAYREGTIKVYDPKQISKISLTYKIIGLFIKHHKIWYYKRYFFKLMTTSKLWQ